MCNNTINFTTQFIKNNSTNLEEVKLYVKNILNNIFIP